MTEPKKTSCLQKCPSNDIELVLLSGKTHSDTQTSQGDTSNDSKFLQNPDDTTPLKDIRAKRLRQTSTHDGVFSNMAARPELMVLPKPSTDLPPPYDGNNDYESRFMGSGVQVIHDHDEVIVDEMEVGGYPVFVLYLVVAVFFEWIGFLLAFALAQSHAARFGAWAGFGITVALQSVRFADLTAESAYWRQHSDLASFLSFLFAFLGYVLFLYGLFSYHRMRNEAQYQTSTARAVEFIGVV